MNNAKKLIYVIFSLLLTVIFQSGAIIRLSSLVRQFSRKVTVINISAIDGDTNNNRNNNNRSNDNINSPDDSKICKIFLTIVCLSVIQGQMLFL